MDNERKDYWEMRFLETKDSLARVTSERNEEVQSNVELREKLYNVRNDNDRLREAVNSLLREWHGWAGCLEDHPPTFTAAIAAAETLLESQK